MKILYRKSNSQKEGEKYLLDNLRKSYYTLHNMKRPISFSDYIDMSLVNNSLTISICSKNNKNPILDNMQNDGAAFEGWAVCLMSWITTINKIVLKWETYTETKNNGHYNRFLYRVIKFKEMFDWFEIDDKHMNEISNFKSTLNNLKNNSAEKTPERPSDLKETRVEYDLVNIPYNQDIMKNFIGINKLNQHLPVGIKKNGISFFTGGASAIDLWGITNNNELLIFELKYIKKESKSKNIKVGIISELLLYLNIMHDVFQNKIEKPKSKLTEEVDLYNSQIQNIIGCFLANEYHPLLENDNVIKLLNENNLNLSFRKYYFSFNEKSNMLVSIK
jgi:hypothetical protein